VYGTRWHPAWSALIVLALFGAARTVLTLFSDLAIALGLTRRLLGIQLSWLILLTPIMVFCVNRWGITGAGIAHATVVILVVIPLYLVTVKRRTAVGLSWIPSTMAIPFIAAAAAGAAAYAGTRLFDGELTKLLVGLACGLVTYAVAAGLWLRQLRQELMAMYWHERRHSAKHRHLDSMDRMGASR
jgi:lipopolysaccharide exporter